MCCALCWEVYASKGGGNATRQSRRQQALSNFVARHKLWAHLHVVKCSNRPVCLHFLLPSGYAATAACSWQLPPTSLCCPPSSALHPQCPAPSGLPQGPGTYSSSSSSGSGSCSVPAAPHRPACTAPRHTLQQRQQQQQVKAAGAGPLQAAGASALLLSGAQSSS